MELKKQLFDLCNKLAASGWQELFLEVTNGQLDIGQPDASVLLQALKEVLTSIDRSIPGFEDFCLEGRKGITASSFARSLFYHALASPGVTNAGITYYPTLDDLGIVENIIYSAIAETDGPGKTLASLKAAHGNRLFIAVFAYQYRNGQGSSHRAHADMNYSRTGIARIGTAPALYDTKRRSFWVGDNDGEISVLPSRFGAFLAVENTGNLLGEEFSVMDKIDEDDRRKFLVPVHKLFSGDECLADITLPEIAYETYHRNEKLKKVHDPSLPGTIPLEASYDLNQFPFIIDDHTQPGFLYEIERQNSNLLIKPEAGKIVEPAVQNGRYVAFKVPSNRNRNRFSTSFQIPADTGGRQSPEYVNIRHMVTSTIIGSPERDIVSLNDLPSDQFKRLIQEGNYLAVDFVDKSADGFVKVKSDLASLEGLKCREAYSVITALDFFPLVNQRDVYRWDQSDDVKHFNQGDAEPLSNGRIRANLNYADLQNDNFTLTAVVSAKEAHPEVRKEGQFDDPSISYLPDGASNVFAPGWDISMDRNDTEFFHASYGLGSPFPEDAKLCAALNSFWPAAAPDASRTFFQSNTFTNFSKQPTAIPLTDDELGIYSLTKTDPVNKCGWDGEFGPFLQLDGGKEFVNYADIARSDYTGNAWGGLMHMDLLRNVTSKQLIARMKAIQDCLAVLPPGGDSVISNNLWLVSFREIAEWSNEQTSLGGQLTGSGFAFVFVTPGSGVPAVSPDDIRRLRIRVADKFECQIAQGIVLWRQSSVPGSPVNVVNRTVRVPQMNLISSFL